MPADSQQTDTYVVVVNWPAMLLTVAILAAVATAAVVVVRRVGRNRRARLRAGDE